MFKAKTKTVSKITTVSFSEDVLKAIAEEWEQHPDEGFNVSIADKDGNLLNIEMEIDEEE